MTKRYCDRCGQQIDEGVHAWYVLELHGTDGEFRHKELCEECYELLVEDNYIPSIDIVRCGQCMHNGSYDTDCPFGWRNGEWNLPKPCDFCSYGEREGE